MHFKNHRQLIPSFTQPARLCRINSTQEKRNNRLYICLTVCSSSVLLHRFEGFTKTVHSGDLLSSAAAELEGAENRFILICALLGGVCGCTIRWQICEFSCHISISQHYVKA